MKLAVLMDPVHKLKAYKDSTVAMLKSAQALGWSCVYFTQDDLYCRQGHAYARVFSIKIGDENASQWAEIKEQGEQALNEFDILLMRKDPPFDMEYIYSTYALQLAERDGVLVANKPSSLRDANEKFFTLNFPQCCPQTLVSRDIKRLRAFWKEHQNVIFKPLEGMGGSSVFHVNENAENLSVILEMLTEGQTANIMAQQYIPEITSLGDKRILLINGEPVPYALARIPAKGELRGNLAAGARGKVVAITERDRWLCQQIAPTLKSMGLYFVGIDVIGDYLTEINVTSPTCIREIEAETNLDIAGDYLRCLAELVSSWL
ncbi:MULTISPECIES: glutathione synthase [Legionella]|uniref:Glutathione synthetase n=1 Tax=Legionella drozanskii LLAP-1 TaxID=1212489 RepID=A0A0W0SRM2_9GAMM|nr:MULTISPECIES: glutathione synthase [Legionella]KTC85995.1 glutathione synthetase [Legionella drozanskii LLAP-1]PJE09897.1 MAG: glutathione synthase [Legionella sp.]